MKNPFETSIIEKPLSSYDFENSYPEKSCSNAIGLGGNEFSHDFGKSVNKSTRTQL
jgi:hypothetical protein